MRCRKVSLVTPETAFREGNGLYRIIWQHRSQTKKMGITVYGNPVQGDEVTADIPSPHICSRRSVSSHRDPRQSLDPPERIAFTKRGCYGSGTFNPRFHLASIPSYVTVPRYNGFTQSIPPLHLSRQRNMQQQQYAYMYYCQELHRRINTIGMNNHMHVSICSREVSDQSSPRKSPHRSQHCCKRSSG